MSGAGLLVEGAGPADAGRGVARLARADMAALGLRAGDVIAVAPPAGGRAAHARVLPAAAGAPAGRIRLDDAQRLSAGLALGDAAHARAVPPPPPAQSVTLTAAEGAAPMPADLGALLEEQPLAEGDSLIVRVAGGRMVTLRVQRVAPGPLARVTAATALSVEGASVAPAAWGGVAGLDAQVARVREMIETPLRRPDLFARLGMTPPRGVLFTGPPGSGKTLLARAVAQECGAAFFQIDGPEIVSKHYGDSEAKLREIFAEAQKRAPSVVFIDEIDAIAPKRDSLSGDRQLERRLVAQLLTLLDGVSARGRVVVMAATNLPDSLDPALRRPGRFDREIAFGAPDRAGRRAILALHLARAPLGPDVDLDAAAGDAAGFVGADLAALAREAAMAALRRAAEVAGGLDAVAAGDLCVTAADLTAARRMVGPSVLRAADVERPATRWSDVGGLAQAKAALVESVLWPLRHPEACAALGVAPSAGVLLAGPPGSGKTMLARALATESGANFIAVRAAQLLSRYLGDAERAVAEVFAQARAAAPCILFFDEIDAVAPARGLADAAMARVVAQLLVEMDGFAGRGGLFLLGATNRVEAIDPALLRPGRFDEIVLIGAPDEAARLEILQAHAPAALTADAALLEAAAATEGWSGAELRGLCHGAARTALRRALRAGVEPAAARVEAADFTAARLAMEAGAQARRGAGERA